VYKGGGGRRVEKQTITKEIVKKDRCEEEAPDVFESFSSESG